MAKQTQRLDKFLTATTELTRSLAKKALHRGEVLVNGEVVKDPGMQIGADDQVVWREAQLEDVGLRYLLLNKPLGYECTRRSSHHPLVVDLLDLPRKNLIQPVGRLDLDTSGLLLLTDDGQWLHKITSPKHHKEKVYLAELAEPLVADAAARLAEGLMLDGDDKPTRPAFLETMSATCVRLTVTEGRYHLVRRLFAALGNHVVSLHREAVADIQLNIEELPAGQWRYLTEEEVSRAVADKPRSAV
ncbi:16S rRNA pseudouridine516 synthase [Marinospirillum celere]|uniref:Pseudouridine synthase n=1 Tax=Marinospirillum celere TaxID=1122252 RepID=A0A1I1F2M9_9GAMM|nr:pseudouridine synthase [Marinospirillum celere]SFB91420.1 16S rRNA pseudouridine516 synthase [Marinospirillum celere]